MRQPLLQLEFVPFMPHLHSRPEQLFQLLEMEEQAIAERLALFPNPLTAAANHVFLDVQRGSPDVPVKTVFLKLSHTEDYD